MPTGERVVFTGEREVTVESHEVPEPGPGEVLIRTERTLVSTGTELTMLSGEFPEGSNWDDITDYPLTPGYNNVGEVVRAGEGAEDLEGRRVATYSDHAAYVVTDAEACRPVPEDVSTDAASFFTIAEIVMNGVRRGRVDWGEATVVYGLGLLGQLATRCCRVAGARPVVAAEVAQPRLDLLPDDPAVVGVDPTAEDVGAVVREHNHDRLADAVFEVTGNPEVITSELDGLREQGRFVVLSSPRGETTLDFHDHCNAPSYEIIGAHNSSHPPTATPSNPWTQKRHAELFFDLLADGELSVDELVSHREPVARAPDLYEKLLEDRSDAMGVLIDWE